MGQTGVVLLAVEISVDRIGVSCGVEAKPQRMHPLHKNISLSLGVVSIHFTLQTTHTTTMTSIASSRWGPSNGRPSTGRQSTNRLSTARPTTSSRSRHARTAVSTIGGAQKVVCAITESRGISATVGLCFVDMSTGECHLSEICDSQTYAHTVNKLFVHDPSEVLLILI